ncbi:FG-GAP repeat protein [bacterium]|nr:FG-GAP repeat protein [bacterium]
MSVATAGDVNGDGYSDVIVGSSLYDNGTKAEGETFVYWGWSIRTFDHSCLGGWD